MNVLYVFMSTFKLIENINIRGNNVFKKYNISVCTLQALFKVLSATVELKVNCSRLNVTHAAMLLRHCTKL